MCIRYHNEIVTIEKIAMTQPLGLLYLMLIDFRDTALPEPRRLLEIAKNVIPWWVSADVPDMGNSVRFNELAQLV